MANIMRADNYGHGHAATGPAVESRAWVASRRKVRLRGLGTGKVPATICKSA